MAEGYALSQPYGSGLGTQYAEPGAAPAAGADFASAFDQRLGTRRLVAVVFTLTAGAAAANRYVTVEYQDGAGRSYCVDAASVVVTANTTQRYCGSVTRAVAEWNTGTDVLFPLTPVYIKTGFNLRIVVANIQAADTLTGIMFLTDRFAEGSGPEPYESD